MIATRISTPMLMAFVIAVALSPAAVQCQMYNLRETTYQVPEGETHVIVEIVRSGSVDVPTSVLVTTMPDTATSPADFTLLNQRREFVKDSLYLTVRIDIADDDLRESDEYFWVQISSPSAGMIVNDSMRAKITIQDDDSSFKFSSSSYPPASESDGSITIAVVREGYLNKEVNVYISTLDNDPNNPNSATPGTDFNRLEDTQLKFPSGTDRIEVPVRILDNPEPEEAELLVVEIVRVVGGQRGTPYLINLLILDNDVEYAIAQESFSVKESTSSSSLTVSVTITRRFNIDSQSTIMVYTEDGTASATSGDYVVSSNRVTFPPGVSSATATITVLDDNEYEQAEVFYVGIRDPKIGNNPSGYVLASASRVAVTIEDNESIFSLLKTAYTVIESDESVTVQIRRTGDLSQPSSVRVRTIAVSASSAQDYAHVDQELMFAVDQAGVNLQISIANDEILEEKDEVFIVELYQAAVSVLDPDRSSAQITIKDSPRLSTLAIVLIAVGCAIFVILILIMLLCCCAFMRPRGPREPLYYHRDQRGVPGVDFPQEAIGRGPVATYIPDELNDRQPERLEWPHRRSDRRINGSVVQNGGTRINELNERDYESQQAPNRAAPNDQPPSPPPPPPAQERPLEERNNPEQFVDRHGEPSDPRRARSMFNPRGEREPYWAKARHSHHSSPNTYGYF